MTVVDFEAAVQWILIINIQSTSTVPRCDASAQRRRDAPVRPLIERDDVLRHRIEIRQLAFSQRRGPLLDLIDVEIVRILDAKRPTLSSVTFRTITPPCGFCGGIATETV